MFKNLFGKRSSVGLDIGASSVKMVELAGKANNLTLTALGSGPLTPDALVDGQILDAEQTSAVIGELLQSQNVKTTNVAAGVGSYSTIIKIITLPLMSEEELSESIDWHAEEHIPFDLADVRLDYQIVDSTSDSLKVLIIACKHEPLRNLEQVLGRAGYRAAVIDADSLALQNCYTFNYQPASDSLVALIHVGASKMIINIVRGRRCEYTREVSVGGNEHTNRIQKKLGLTFEQAEAVKLGATQGVQINAANIGDALDGLSKLLTDEERIDDLSESVLDLFEQEISKTLDFYRAYCEEGEFEVQKIMLSGGGAHQKGLREMLARSLEAPVELLDPFRRIKCDSKRFSPDYLSRIGPEMAIAVGLSLRGTNSQGLVEINLTESNIEQKRVEPAKIEDERADGVYEFTGRNRLNEVVRGERVATGPENLRLMLKREQVVLTSCKLKERPSTPRRRKPKKIKESDIERFTRRFSILVDMGLPLVSCLNELAREQTNERFGQVLEQVCQDIDEGSTLANAFERQTKVFGKLYVKMIEAGEWGGYLDTILPRLADELERRAKLRLKIRLALLYPLSVFAVVLAVAALMLVRGGSGGGSATNVDLSFWSNAVASVGAFLVSAPALVLLALIAVSLLLYAYVKTSRGRRRIDELLLRLPFLGPFLRRYMVARFARTLSMLLSSGFPILDSLDITEKSVGNVVFKDAVRNLRYGVERGESFHGAMSEVFPGVVRLLMGVGEQTGATDCTLGKIADLYEKEIDRTMTVLPVLILFGMAVLFALIVGVTLLFAR